jgi:ribosomal RNA-processing protein 12
LTCDRDYLGAKSNRRRKPGQEAARFKTDEDTGKMIIDEDSGSDGGAGKVQKPSTTDVAGSAYRESITSVDGFTRGQGGRVKFNKDTKKRRMQNEEADEDVEMVDGELVTHNKKRKKKEPSVKFGHEFKAKVCSFLRFVVER